LLAETDTYWTALSSAKLAHASNGALLLGIVAAGLTAFGLYSLSDARYRRI
jgi:hypothetical protein